MTETISTTIQLFRIFQELDETQLVVDLDTV